MDSFFYVAGPDLYWSDILKVLYDVMSLTNSDELLREKKGNQNGSF